jgi:hypothetical protein
MTPLPLAPAYRGAVKVALALQVPIAILLLLMLDGGFSARIGGCVMAGFWIGAAVIMVRRPKEPKPLDLLYVKWGYAPLLLLGLAIAGAIVARVR